jgi:hypothetical protein
MRQRRWLELIKDYDCETLYHPGKANVVADALSRKENPKPIRVKSCKIVMIPDVMKQIGDAREEALKEDQVKGERMKGQEKELIMDARGVRTRFGSIWIPRYEDLKEGILDEAHKTRYSVHPSAAKMYQDLKKYYWWPNMKFGIKR